MSEQTPCEACGQDVSDVEGTAWVGAYCIKCHRLVISESREAIKNMRERARIETHALPRNRRPR